jgi:hypothetical protein
MAGFGSLTIVLALLFRAPPPPATSSPLLGLHSALACRPTACLPPPSPTAG